MRVVRDAVGRFVVMDGLARLRSKQSGLKIAALPFEERRVLYFKAARSMREELARKPRVARLLGTDGLVSHELGGRLPSLKIEPKIWVRSTHRLRVQMLNLRRRMMLRFMLRRARLQRKTDASLQQCAADVRSLMQNMVSDLHTMRQSGANTPDHAV